MKNFYLQFFIVSELFKNVLLFVEMQMTHWFKNDRSIIDKRIINCYTAQSDGDSAAYTSSRRAE